MWNEVNDASAIDIPWTYNAIEGWHRVFVSTFGFSSLHIILLVYKF